MFLRNCSPVILFSRNYIGTEQMLVEFRYLYKGFFIHLCEIRSTSFGHLWDSFVIRILSLTAFRELKFEIMDEPKVHGQVTTTYKVRFHNKTPPISKRLVMRHVFCYGRWFRSYLPILPFLISPIGNNNYQKLTSDFAEWICKSYISPLSIAWLQLDTD